MARAEDLGKARPVLHVDRVLREHPQRLAMALVPDRLWKVLDQVAAAQDVQQLEPAADGERRQVAMERRAEERELGRISVQLRGVGCGMALVAVLRRVDVDPAREDQPVEHVERLVDPDRAGRDEERPASRPLPCPRRTAASSACRPGTAAS